jgi:3-dehydroquinate synthetase
MAERAKDHAALTLRNDDLQYPIFVAQDPREALRSFLETGGRLAAILSDVNPPVRGVAREIAATSDRAPVLAFTLGESHKRLSTVERVVDAMLAGGVERGSLVVGVGGGVAADLFGFACATYMRGVRYAHVATSLVAMVDAAIGGKTSVNVRDGKNIAGAFRDPVAVFCHAGSLRTLPEAGFAEGLAEIVKAAVIEGGEFFDRLEELSGDPLRRWPWVEVISTAIKVKTMAVADDRLEAGARATLNLGHTFAHAIERASRYRVAHGKAVALGLRAAGLLAIRTGRFSRPEHLRVLTLLTLAGLPLQTAVAPEAILAAMRSDKKKSGGRLRFVLPNAIGDVEYGIECSPRSVQAVLERLRYPPESFRARG